MDPSAVVIKVQFNGGGKLDHSDVIPYHDFLRPPRRGSHVK